MLSVEVPDVPKFTAGLLKYQIHATSSSAETASQQATEILQPDWKHQHHKKQIMDARGNCFYACMDLENAAKKSESYMPNNLQKTVYLPRWT